MELEVLWAGENPAPVGRLYQNERGVTYFEYDPRWRRGSRELSPLYLPNETSGAVTTPTPAFGDLHGLFQDTLPDWWGERLMRKFFEDRGIPWRRVTSLRKLACQGERKMGALAFRPEIDSADFNDGMVVELGALVDAARATLRGESADVLGELARSGMSPGGAQPKALLAVSDDFSEIRLDDPPPENFGAWLVKFDIDPELHEGRIEMAYAAMARAAGIDVPETRLMETTGAAHFFVRRFDRTGDGKRLHLHSFSGITHTPLRDGIEYGEMMNLARVLMRDERAVEEIFRRAVFNVMAANDDDHGRNHAFLMDDDGEWRLAPAFDLTLATYPLASGFRAGRIDGKAAEIARRDLLELGTSQSVRNVNHVIDEVLAAVADWRRHAEDAGLPRHEIVRIGSQHGI
ncbi:MAG: type II toxin-antitoxin system HipA family toxin [Verrucomicrobiota bacterium]